MVALVALAAAVVPARAQDEKVTLRYKFSDREKQSFSVRMAMDIAIPEMDVKMAMRGTSTVRFDVDATGRTTKLRVVVERMVMDAPIRFDSDQPADRRASEDMPEMRPVLAMIGVPIAIELRDTGEVVGYDLDALKKAFADAGLDEIPSGIREQLESLAEGEFVLFPEKPVAKGDQWKGRLKTTVLDVGRLKADYTFTLAEIERVGDDVQARIKVAGAATLEKDPDVEVDAKLAEYEEAGEIVFSITRGRVVRSTVDGRLKIEVRGAAEYSMRIGTRVRIEGSQR